MVDELGATVPVPDTPRRVVSLVPSLTEAVATSAPEILVGATDYCTHPEGLAVARVGGSKYPKVATVLAAEPDLVIANAEENRPDEVAELRAAGVPVWVTAAPGTVPAGIESVRRVLVEVLGLAEPDWVARASQLWRDPLPIRARAVVPVWRKPWVVLGRDTFAGDVLRRLGIANAYGEHADRYPRPKIAELRERFDTGEADLLVLPDEPYEFTKDDGPDWFPGVHYALVCGRYLTWYGPSLVAAHQALRTALAG
ncbi:helical backbone metal receptor [Tamaricihabitans halophyticus]|uniref:helical backbone metal receptor n=1 Tax=Tamaricihabitans halophyticus TaxID=1262583 RepID=UPI0010521379|nr:helical backbone metal receptor [Tamaricihabitans halophyticus]